MDEGGETMREISFNQHWPKLDTSVFTTFRFPRKDRDWAIGEKVRVVLSARSKKREVLFEAVITKKEARWVRFQDYPLKQSLEEKGIPIITSDEARADGFFDTNKAPALYHFQQFMLEAYEERIYREPMNKLSLSRIEP